MDLRLAHVHLRMGALELARAELESFAGRGSLDPQALLDLAEVRWRTGDLPGAGVAASAYLGTDDSGTLALVIAAEAAAAVGHPGDARRLAQEALERLEEASVAGVADVPGPEDDNAAVAGGAEVAPAAGGAEVAPAAGGAAASALGGSPPPTADASGSPDVGSRGDVTGAEALDAIFAGMPQSQIWPMRPHFRVEPTGLLFVTPLQGIHRTGDRRPMPGEAMGSPEGEHVDEPATADRWSGEPSVAGGEHREGPRAPERMSSAFSGGRQRSDADDMSGAPSLWGDGTSVGPGPDDSGSGPHPELADARVALEAGDAEAAAQRLGDLLRRRPDLAGSVLAALATDGGPDHPAADSPAVIPPKQERP
jgi:hypothetical protein